MGTKHQKLLKMAIGRQTTQLEPISNFLLPSYSFLFKSYKSFVSSFSLTTGDNSSTPLIEQFLNERESARVETISICASTLTSDTYLRSDSFLKNYCTKCFLDLHKKSIKQQSILRNLNFDHVSSPE